MKTVDELVADGQSVKEMVSATTYEGKSWKVVTVESFARMLTIIERRFILEVLKSAKPNITGFMKGVDIIVNHVGECKLEGLPLSLVAAMTPATKDLVIILAVKMVINGGGAGDMYVPNITIDLEKGSYTITDPSTGEQYVPKKAQSEDEIRHLKQGEDE
jgi:hypothetical protein